MGEFFYSPITSFGKGEVNFFSSRFRRHIVKVLVDIDEMYPVYLIQEYDPDRSHDFGNVMDVNRRVFDRWQQAISRYESVQQEIKFHLAASTGEIYDG